MNKNLACTSRYPVYAHAKFYENPVFFVLELKRQEQCPAKLF
jgi:hypothetical protein